MKKVVLFIGILGLVGAIYAFNRIRAQEPSKSLLEIATTDPLAVVVVQPELQSIIRTVEAPGDVEAVFEVEIRSEIPAKIEEMPVQEGDTVKTGQLLCRLNDDEYRALVESGEASAARLGSVIRQAEADLEKSRRDWARQQELAERHATSNIELADYRTLLVKSEVAVEATKHQLAESEAMLRRARENLKKTIITSPIDGVISKVQAKAGEIVVTGTMNNPGTSIMRITDMSRMQVKARVDETDVPLVRPEQPVNIFVPSEPDRPIPGWVLRVATAGSKPAGRDVVTFETLVMVETNDGSVKPGMTANVEIQVDRKDNVLTVPVQAVVHRKRKELPEELVAEYERRQAELGLVERQNRAQYMTVVFSKDDDKARPHLVRTGIADEARVELVEGIGPDDVIIIGPYRSLDQLKDGSAVKLEEPKPGTETTAPETMLANEQEGAVRVETDDQEVAKSQ
jgi:HlyD family secretion protein